MKKMFYSLNKIKWRAFKGKVVKFSLVFTFVFVFVVVVVFVFGCFDI